MLKSNLFAILLVVLVSSCSSNSTQKAEPTVTVSIIPQKFFVDQISGGDWLKVNVMVPPGGSPATYEPTPQQMTQLNQSSVYFRIGQITFEKAWIDKLASVAPEVKFIDTSAGIEFIAEESFGDEAVEDSDGDHHEGVNPHIWLSPDLVKKQAAIICTTLCNLYPEKANVMQDNLKTFNHKIDSTREALGQQLKSAGGTNFIVYHPVWSYLAKDYNLTQIAIEHNGKEATADKMKKIIDFARANHIHLIFVQKEFSNIQAKSIAKEINGEVALMNPLDYNWFNTMKEFGDVFVKLQK